MGKLMTTNSKKAKQEVVLVEDEASLVLNTIIEIEGQQFVQKPLTANQFFEYESRKESQSIALANEWLIYEAYGDIDLSKLKFRARGELLLSLSASKISYHDDLPLNKTSDFSVAGNRYTEKEDSGDCFDTFIAKVSNNAVSAYKWAIPRVVLINGEEISTKHFETPSPEGMGLEGAGVLVRWLQSFLLSSQSI